jgi:phage FluMu protein Com
MAIEFRCTHCDKLLSTQSGTEGQKAKCPQCGTIQVIPNSSSAAGQGVRQFDAPAPRQPDFAPPPEAPPPRDPNFADTAPYARRPGEANPYESPLAYSQAATVPRGFNPTQIELGETFSKTWQIYKANLGACMGGTFVMVACSILIGGLVQALLLPLGALLGRDAFIVTWVLQQVVGQVISAFFYIGIILFMLRIARGQSPEFGLLFGGGPFLLYGFAIQIIVFLATLGGFILLVVPGIIIALMLSQAMFMLVDQRADIAGSLKMSVETMKGNKLTVFGIWLLGGLLTILVTVFTCGIGMLFALPFMTLLTAVVYLSVTGQRTVEDPAAHYDRERPFEAPGMQPT